MLTYAYVCSQFICIRACWWYKYWAMHVSIQTQIHIYIPGTSPYLSMFKEQPRTFTHTKTKTHWVHYLEEPPLHGHKTCKHTYRYACKPTLHTTSSRLLPSGNLNNCCMHCTDPLLQAPYKHVSPFCGIKSS